MPPCTPRWHCFSSLLDIDKLIPKYLLALTQLSFSSLLDIDKFLSMAVVKLAMYRFSFLLNIKSTKVIFGAFYYVRPAWAITRW